MYADDTKLSSTVNSFSDNNFSVDTLINEELLLNSGMTCQIIFRVLTLLAALGEPFICF